jgi:uncharacterized protein (DUF983 family)
MTKGQGRAILAVVIICIADVLFIVHFHAVGRPERWSEIAVWFGMGLYAIILFWVLLRANAGKKRSSVNWN